MERGWGTNVADFRLSLDGEDVRGALFDSPSGDVVDLTGKVRPRLLSLRLTEKRGGDADQLELELDDTDGQLALPRKGAVIALRLGWARGADVPVGLVDKGTFKVDEVEWSGASIRVTARSADLTNSFRVRQEKSHVATTLGAIARKVAAAQHLMAKIAPELDGIAIPVLAQHHVSDMALLRRLGAEHDAVATVKAGKLLLTPIGRGVSPGGKALPGFTISRSDGSSPRYREIDRSADAGVEARYHDQDSATRGTVTAGGSGSGPGSGKAGTQGSGAKPHRVRKVFHSRADAQAAADAQAKRKARGEAEFEFTLALGRPDLYPERPVTLSGFKPQADARRWIVAELTHALDARGGLATSLKLETKA